MSSLSMTFQSQISRSSVVRWVWKANVNVKHLSLSGIFYIFMSSTVVTRIRESLWDGKISFLSAAAVLSVEMLKESGKERRQNNHNVTIENFPTVVFLLWRSKCCKKICFSKLRQSEKSLIFGPGIRRVKLLKTEKCFKLGDLEKWKYRRERENGKFREGA